MTTMNENEIREAIVSTWWVPFVQGIVAIILGLWAFTRPGQTVATILFLFGLYWIINGVFAVVAAVSSKGQGQKHRTWQLIGGVLTVLAGIFAVSQPWLAGIVSASVVGIIIGLSAIAGGIVQMLAGRVVMDGMGFEWSWGNFFYGVLNVIFGIIVIANPAMSIAFFIQIFAILAILGGLALLYAAWRIRSLA